jgi:hypothetical protein
MDFYRTSSIIYSSISTSLAIAAACAAAGTKGEQHASRPLLEHHPAPETLFLNKKIYWWGGKPMCRRCFRHYSQNIRLIRR